jgi:WD40 repeat protein
MSLWNTIDGSLVSNFTDPQRGLESLAFSPDDSAIAGVHDRFLHVWEKQSAPEDTYLNTLVFPDTCRLWTVIFPPEDNDAMLTTNKEGTVRLWRRSESVACLRMTARERWPLETHFSPDGKWLVTAGAGVQAYSTDDLSRPVPLAPADTDVWNAAFSPDGRLLAAFHRNFGVTIWTTRDWEKRKSFPVNGIRHKRIEFTRDGALLRLELQEDIKPTRAPTPDPGPKWSDLPTAFYDPETGKQAAQPDDPIYAWPREAVVLCPRRKLFSVLLRPDQIEVHDDEGIVFTAPCPGNSWTCQAFSMDGSMFAAARSDGIIELWETENPKPRLVFARGSQLCEKLAFSPDGRTLAGSVGRRTVKLWNVATGGELLTLDVPFWERQSLDFSPEGRLPRPRSGGHFSHRFFGHGCIATPAGSPGR